MDYMIVVNDNGELKSITAREIDKEKLIDDEGNDVFIGDDLVTVINKILDRRSATGDVDATDPS